MRGDNCYPGRGKWVKIPLLPENVGKRSLNYLGTLGTLERVTTVEFTKNTMVRNQFRFLIMGYVYCCFKGTWGISYERTLMKFLQDIN